MQVIQVVAYLKQVAYPLRFDFTHKINSLEYSEKEIRDLMDYV